MVPALTNHVFRSGFVRDVDAMGGHAVEFVGLAGDPGFALHKSEKVRLHRLSTLCRFGGQYVAHIFRYVANL